MLCTIVPFLLLCKYIPMYVLERSAHGHGYVSLYDLHNTTALEKPCSHQLIYIYIMHSVLVLEIRKVRVCAYGFEVMFYI